MATIPRSQGPRVMPGSARPVQYNGSESGAASARALEQLGNAGMQVAFDLRGDEIRAERALKVEQKRLADEQKRQAEKADQAREMAHLGKTEDELADARDGFLEGLRDGTVPKEDAEKLWDERSKKITGDALAGFRDQTKPLVVGQLERTGMRMGNEVRKARSQRDRQDVTAGIDQVLEHNQRLYRTDPKAAEESTRATLEGLGPFSLYNPQQIAAKGQAWREQTQYTMAFEAISAARDDRNGLKVAGKLLGELDGIDPQKRAALDDRISAYRLRLDQQAEVAAARAQRQAEATMRKAEAEFQTFQALTDKGTALSPEYIDRASRATAGTPYQAGIKALAQQAVETGGLAAQSVPVQQATLDAINAHIAKTGRTPELDKRRQQIEGVLQGSRADIEKDPLRAGLERGVIADLRPLNLSAGVPGLVQQLGGRVQQAQQVGQWAGRAVSPLLEGEAETLALTLGSLPPDQKAQSIALLASTMGPQQAQAVAKQVNGKDRALSLAMAAGSSMTTYGRPVSTLILKGQQAVKDRSIKEDSGVGFGDRARIAETVGDALSGQAREDVIDAARFIYLGMQAEGQGADYDRAVRLAVGGDIVEHAGQRIPVPPGVTAANLPAALAAAAPKALSTQAKDGKVFAAGRELTAEQFLAGVPQAQLQPAGQGRYFVRAGGALVTNSERRPIVIEVPSVNP